MGKDVLIEQHTVQGVEKMAEPSCVDRLTVFADGLDQLVRVPRLHNVRWETTHEVAVEALTRGTRAYGAHSRPLA